VNKSPQVDRYIHDRLPTNDQWPELILPNHFQQRIPLNCANLLLDRRLEEGLGSKTAFVSKCISWSYSELYERTCRMAHVLTNDFGVQPGNRVLIRGPNSPTLAAIWIAIQKIGAIAVTTMSLLRSRELAKIIEKAKPILAVCDCSIVDELRKSIQANPHACEILTYDESGGELENRMIHHPEAFENCSTFSDDISLIGFTSGTTGEPKGTIHFHRDVMSVCETVAEHIIHPVPNDIFISTAPLAFTFGLGGLVLFPLYGGSTSVLNGRYSPEELLDAFEKYKATICFTVPTFYQKMARLAEKKNFANLRMSISSGEALAQSVKTEWLHASGQGLTELLGSTEMLHAFIGPTEEQIPPETIGKAIPGYRVAILGNEGEHLPTNEIGHLAVKGPTACRYLEDSRQKDYVQFGWNITGDACSLDKNGYVIYHTRVDDMIISSGYNISGIEVENVLLENPKVSECAVIGTRDPERGQVVTAYIVPKDQPKDETGYIEDLQSFVRSRLAPYKYPRKIKILTDLPRNESGKLQRFRLKE
jgi:2-aminobenzoate-CoA ligase